MSELIDRQAALDALCDACALASVKSECIFKNLESCMDHNAILDVPTIEERKTGKWIETDSHEPCWFKCDQCGRLSDIKEIYCPTCGASMANTTCGADMRGEECT